MSQRAITSRIVMFSGGLMSYEAARRTVATYGRDGVELWFADTKSEDPDLYRFNADVSDLLGIKIEVFADGRDLWQLFEDVGMIGNTRVDICSRVLKRDLLKNALVDRCNPGSTRVVFGMDAIEDCRRIEMLKRGMAPYKVELPLLDDPYVTKNDIAAELRSRGVEPPSLYGLGAAHNNCGGFCVKAGLWQFEWLLRTAPDRFEYHESK